MATYRKRGLRWQVQIRRLGHQTINRSFKSKADAEVWARGLEAQIDKAALPPNYRQLKTIRLEQLIGRYLELISPRKKSHYKEKYRLLQLQKTPMASLTLDKVTPAVFARYRDERLTQVGPQAIRHDLNVLGHMFKIAIREWGVPLTSNPIELISKPPISRSRDRRLSNGELAKLEIAAEQRWGKLAKDLIDMAVETGMRKSELLAMQWQHVDFNKKTLLIPETKNGHPRTIPLSPKALEILARYRFSNQCVVWPITLAWLRAVWQYVTEKAGSQNLHFHDLRHEAISRFFEKGLSVPEVALISGHRDVRQLFRYTHLRAEDVVAKLG